MGNWGYDVFCDDTALDVRDAYRKLVQDEPDIGDREATRQMTRGLGDEEPVDDIEAVAWLALAVCQSELGRLDPAVADRAVRIIDNDEGMDGWREAGTPPWPALLGQPLVLPLAPAEPASGAARAFEMYQVAIEVFTEAEGEQHSGS